MTIQDSDFTRILSNSESTIKQKSVINLRPASREILEKMLNSKLVTAIKGLRGVGKSSLLIEFLKRMDRGMYINAEFLLKYGYDLYEVLEYASAQGFTSFGIDEVQVLNNWTSNIKLFYDSAKAKMAFTGSSAIEVSTKSSDLARRSEIQTLKPFSFREFIFMKSGKLFQKESLEQILEQKTELTKDIAPFVNLYSDYVNNSALPAAFFEGRGAYGGIVERTIYHDLILLKSIDESYIECAFKVMKFLVSSKPGQLSYNSIANSIGRSVKFTMELMRLLDLSDIVELVPSDGSGHTLIRTENKVLLPLSFRSALAEYFGVNHEIGALREDFFVQHVKEARFCREFGKKAPDYAVGEYKFEIGGPSKGHEQLAKLEKAYLAKESLSCGKREVPIYLFGLLY